MSAPVSSIGKIAFKDVLQAPNVITLGRLILLPIIFFCLRRHTSTCLGVALVLILVAILLDALDGYVAHRFDQVTALGRILDPVVDKISVGCGIIFLIVVRDFPLWAALIILGRDVAILSLVFILIRRKALITSSTFLGKATVLALAGMILFYIVELQPHAILSTYVAVFLVIVSGMDYILGYLRVVRHTHEVKSQ